MNGGPTAERVYQALKRTIMDRGFRPGDRLDPAALADRLNASTTPVREALDRLVGEELVESRPGGGFHVPAIDEPGLKDVYGWSAQLVVLAVRAWPVHPTPVRLIPRADAAEKETLAEQTDRIFGAIARHSLNSEHARAIERLNARIHAARVVEHLVIEGVAEELRRIEAACHESDRAGLRRLLAAYHRRRVRAAAAILRALYRAN